ncbi:alpha/beta fold hydrolase [Sphingomonas hankookensis]|uniref:Alpha/beta hydrolase n=1 Tax=Sphingomonas hengshuiensis TaxID=1609977 RepID=A0A2W4Z0G9_9SPHN|nr:MAG: alpha/beta hydrolase [Sphingomonas hengshuiensis]
MKDVFRKAATATALIGGGLALWTALAASAAEALVPADGAFVDVPGGRLHYVDTGGDGPAVVMLHGLYGQLRNFSYALAAELPDHRLILVDRPGWGHSTVEVEHPTLETQAQMIATLIDTLGLDRPLLVGHSMGGAVALAMALDQSAKIRGIALIAPLTRQIDRLPPVFRGKVPPAIVRSVAAWTIGVPLTTLTGPAVSKRVFAPDPVPMDFGTRGGGLSALRPASFEAGAFELEDANRALSTMVPRYGSITMPVAILYGRDDQLLDPVAQGDVTAGEIPGARLTKIGGGHMIPITRPAETAAWLREFAAA